MPLSYLEGNSADIAATRELGASLNQLALGLPQLRMQQQQMQQQAALNRAMEILRAAQTKETIARAGEYDAQTKHIQEQTKASQDKRSMSEAVGREMARYLVSQSSINGPSVSQIPVIANAAQVAAGNPATMMRSVAQGMQMQDPRFQQFLGLGQRPMMSVPMGNTPYDALSQTAAPGMNVKLSPGQTIVPNIPGQANMYVKPSAQGISSPSALAKVLVDARNLDPESPEYQSITNAVMPLLQSMAGTNAPMRTPAPSPAQRVRVKGPKGETGSVPAGTALPQGWSLAQ